MKQRLIEPRLTEFLHRKASITSTPISGTFELSPLCNMDCKMCYIKMSKEKQESIARLRTKEEWIELAQKAKEKWYKYFMNTYAQTPIVIDSGQGSTVVDLDGKNILILQVDMEHYP